MDILYAGIIAAAAMILLFFKIGIRKVLGYDVFVDVAFTSLLAWMLAGTFSGMMSALIGGAVLSVFLFVAKKFLGYERLAWRDKRLMWRYHA